MTLVKSSKGRFPMLRDSFMGDDTFFNDLLGTRRGLLSLNRLFNGDNGFYALPPINVRDQEENLELELAAPGLTKDDFKIILDDGILTISSEKEGNKEEEKDGYVRKEFSYNTFSRSFSLPDTIDENKDVKASYHDGILKLTLHKKENIKPKPPKKVNVS